VLEQIAPPSEGVAGGRRAVPRGRLAEASRRAGAVGVEARRLRMRAELRAPVHAIDVLLDDLERVNLAGGAPATAPEVVAWLHRVEAGVGVRAPDWVREVDDTTRLHAAVLRWQGAMLDRCRPDRAGIGDMHDDTLDLLLIPHAPMGRFPLGDRGGRWVA
jgi:hypothetical protein